MMRDLGEKMLGILIEDGKRKCMGKWLITFKYWTDNI